MFGYLSFLGAFSIKVFYFELLYICLHLSKWKEDSIGLKKSNVLILHVVSCHFHEIASENHKPIILGRGLISFLP